MKTLFPELTAAALVLCANSLLAQTPPTTPQGFITGEAFTGISGTTVASLTGSPKFPSQPDALMFLPYFEWNATGDITIQPSNWADNYGTRIRGYFYPPTTGDYVFYLASDDNGSLYLSTNATPAGKKLIAQETSYSNRREYLTSGNSTVASKDSSTFATTEWPTKDPSLGGAKITLQANQPYYIEALSKEGGGGDHLSVAVMDPNFSIDSTSPIPGQYLSSDRTLGPLTIVAQPQSQSIDERGSVTFHVGADGTPPYIFQWRKNDADIIDATNLTYVIPSVTMADNNAKFSVVVSGGQGSATSSNAVLTVIPDTVAPALLGAKGNVNLTEVVLRFSEALAQTPASLASNYLITNSTGTLAVSAATLSPDGTVVTLTTAPQTLGTKYTVRTRNLLDTAATPNALPAASKAVFFPMGKLTEKSGFIVFEAENYDRNTDGRWVPNTTRGTPSGGVSMVVPNGGGGNETGTQLEYDVEFAQAATYRVWYRASADNGNDDSAWFWLDGARPAERAASNDASMSGFSGALDFVWRSDAQSGVDPFSVDIPSAGPHVIALALREDGAYFDKFILTTDTSFAPSGLGPVETRQGVPGAPTVTLTAPTAGQVFPKGANIVLSANAAGDLGLEITRVEFTANGVALGQASVSPFSFTWNNVPEGIHAIRATAVDEIGSITTSSSAVIEVGTPPPQALLVVASLTLNPSDAGVKARLESRGWQVSVIQAAASTSADADGKALIIVSSTVSSGEVGDKFRNSTVPAIIWEQALEDNFLMTLNTDGVDRGSQTNQTTINIVKADHPLAAGLGAGIKTTTTAAQDYAWGAPNSNAVIIATMADNPARAVIYGYDKGAVLADGSTPAPARRVMFFWTDNGFAASTADTLKLFDAAVDWASQVKISKPTSARIAWVSFHSASNAPSSGAAGNGFTNAPDIGYTDLLASKGHQVTRIVSSGTPDAALLNAFDLVIISRSVGSGDYQDPPETLAWNGLKVPTMIVNGYVLRNSRLGFTTGATMVDTAGQVRLTVNDTNHPIFAGVALATNTMVNTYAGIVTYNNIVQRGISVNTDAVAGDGTILATIGTPEDPTFGGMVIGEWKAGAVMGNAAGDVLGGPRLVLLTGSREQTISSQAAGIYDLTPDGAQIFLNAVYYMTGTEPAPERPALSVSRTTAGGISITFTGTLEASGSLSGSWTNVANATSPYSVTPSAPQLFYRAKK